jgi:hypothetical protein
MANANILLHGLFFLQYQGNNLIAMTPDHSKHVFLMRSQNQKPPFTNLPQDLTPTNLIGGSTQAPFPPEMPQIDKNITGVGDLVATSTPSKNYRCRLVTLWPLEIVVLRSGGSFSDFHSLSTSTVGANIKKPGLTKLGIVTLLHFETSGPAFTISYFAEHMMPTQAVDVNPVLKASQVLFQQGNNFDLQFSECDWCPNCSAPPICPDPDPLPKKILDWGVIRDDEHSVGEVYRTEDCAQKDMAGSDPANCVQFGLNG